MWWVVALVRRDGTYVPTTLDGELAVSSRGELFSLAEAGRVALTARPAKR